MRLRVIVAVTVTVMLLSFPIIAICGEVVLIGNPLLTVSKLKEKDVEYIFLGKKTNWDDGTKIVFVILNDSATHKAFLKKYIHKSPSEYKRYWKNQFFTGKGSLPRAFSSEQELVKYVSETKGAIGYVSADTKLKEVKTISVK